MIHSTVSAPKGERTKYRLAESMKECMKSIHELPQVREINYGGVAKKQDSKPYGKAVYLNKEELKDTQEILSEGISIYIQQVPTSQIEHADFSK